MAFLVCPQRLGSRRLLAECFAKPLVQLNIRAPKLGYLVVERSGHVLAPSLPLPGNLNDTANRLPGGILQPVGLNLAQRGGGSRRTSLAGLSSRSPR